MTKKSLTAKQFSSRCTSADSDESVQAVREEDQREAHPSKKLIHEECKQRVVVICPGRGSYTKSELGYLNQHQKAFGPFIESMDHLRTQQQQITLSELDNKDRFSPSLHLPGEHASALIYTCAMCDFMSLDPKRYEVVAIAGNSMGWYITLAAGGALSPENAFTLINTMGGMMKDDIIGGQIIYPVVDDNWQADAKKIQCVQNALTTTHHVKNAEAYISIYLGGYLVLAGNEAGLAELQKHLPPIDDKYPMRLNKHAAFHTPLLQSISKQAFNQLPAKLFDYPKVPLIDGRGHIWQPYATSRQALYEYTLGHQVTETYDFTSSIEVALKEFCPDKLVLLGPGNSLGGTIGQTLVNLNWQGIDSKAAFQARQADDPFLISMGLAVDKRPAKVRA